MDGPSLAGMRAFRAVVEAASFKHAGERLGLGGSAVSKLIAALERQLDALLLQRSTRSLTVTEAGQRFYESVVRVLDETDAAVEQLRELGGQPCGQLRVSLPNSFGLLWMARRLPDFLVRYPRLELDLALNDRFVDLVAERYDCALRIGSELADSSLYARRLGSMPRVLVAAPRYLRNAPPLRAPADLADHRALLYSLASAGNQWPFLVNGQAVSVAVAGRLKVDSSLMLRDALVAGLGLTLTPLFVVQDLIESGDLLRLLPETMPAPHGIYGVTSQRRHIGQKTQLFLDFIQQELAQSGFG
jgi:DNA-binding transcriptional LysR family regulator